VARLAASTSIGTGFPGVGAIWAKQGGKRFGWGRCRMGGAEVGAVGFGWGAAKCADRKAVLAAWFWSNRMAASYHASGSKSSGLLEAMVATASTIEGFSPLWNLTTMVFGSA
jgi:hypothetical protein